MSETIHAHGVAFLRSGQCRRCGACGCNKGPCPHHFELGGEHWCKVYTKRHLVCDSCSEAAGEALTHQSCIGFPDNPWIGVIRDGICGYTFERADGGSMDDLPFLFGKPWLRR